MSFNIFDFPDKMESLKDSTMIEGVSSLYSNSFFGKFTTREALRFPDENLAVIYIIKLHFYTECKDIKK